MRVQIGARAAGSISVKGFFRILLASGVVALVGLAVLAWRRTGYFEILTLFWFGVVCLAAGGTGLILVCLFRR